MAGGGVGMSESYGSQRSGLSQSAMRRSGIAGWWANLQSGWNAAAAVFRPVLPSFCNAMFFFFSNRLGCMGSIVASVVLTVIVLAVLRLF